MYKKMESLNFTIFQLFTCIIAALHRYDGLHHGSSYLEHLQFLSAIRSEVKEAPAVDLHDGLISVAIGVAAQLSIQKGRFVTIQELMEY